MSEVGGGTNSKRFTMSHKAGLTMPASRIFKRVRKTRIAKRVQPSSVVFLTAGIEKLLQTLFERSYDSCHDSKKKRLSVKHIRTAMCTDPLLKRHFKHVSLDNTGSVHTYERPRKFEPVKKSAKSKKPVLSARILADADESRAGGGAEVGEVEDGEVEDDRTDAATERRGSDSEGEDENAENEQQQRGRGKSKDKTAGKKPKNAIETPPKKRVSFDPTNDAVRPSKGAVRNKASAGTAKKKQSHAV